MFKVVVVEDEELLRKGLTNFFDWNAYGFELAGEAGNGEKGLEVVRTVKPDLVITDIKMPHMDGIQMTEILMTELPDLQTLVISGYDEFEYAKRAMKAGVSEYILKPIKMEDLKEAVSKIQDKLQKVKREKEELELLKTSRMENRKNLKTTLYAKLLVQGMSPEDIRDEWADEDERTMYAVGIISLKNFSVLYMDCDYSIVMEKDRELETLISGCLKENLSDDRNRHMVILRTNNGERIVCLSGDSSGEVRMLQQFLEKQFRNTRAEFEQVELTFGQVGMGIKGLISSCQNARARNEEKFLRSWQDAARISDRGGMVDFLKYDVQNLSYVIRNGSRDSVSQELSRIKETLFSDNIVSYLQLVLVISNMYYELIRIPRETGGQIEEVIENPHGYYQQLISRMKREDMLQELEKLCIKLNEYCQRTSVDRKKEVMQRADQYIRDHFSQEDLSMKEVAEHAYVSVSYLGMIMKKETGKTFTEYLTDLRLERARQLLAQDSMKNYEIAQACGYTTPAYFSTVFKSIVGKTPTEYRNSLKKQTESAVDPGDEQVRMKN